jgi:hypothetical protein
MSWNIELIGKPDKINERLQRYSESLRDQSKAEFDEAMPHLQALISQAVGENLLIKLKASGHASFSGGEKTYGQVSVAIDPIYGELAL